MKLSKEQEEWFKSRVKNFENLREKRFSLFEGIFIAFVTASIILTVDLIAGEDKFLKIILILFLVFISFELYKKMFIQTQKPVISCMNAIGTVEHGPHIVKDKKGMEWAIFSVSDFIYEDEAKRRTKRWKEDLIRVEVIKEKALKF